MWSLKLIRSLPCLQLVAGGGVRGSLLGNGLPSGRGCLGMDAQPGTNGKYYTHFEVAMIVPICLNEQTTYGTKGLTCPKVLVVDWNLNPDRTASSRPLTSTVNAIRIMTL